MLHEFTCTQCNQHKTHDSEFSTGYGINKDGNKVCFECCGKNDENELKNLPIGGKTIMYLDTKNKVLTNWPGTFKLPLLTGYIREGRHNIARKRYDTWAKIDNQFYHAVQFGDNTHIAHVKRVKPF